jgi:hypothetical protein
MNHKSLLNRISIDVTMTRTDQSEITCQKLLYGGAHKDSVKSRKISTLYNK